MQRTQTLDQAIARALAYLAHEQEADGSFKSFSSSSLDPFVPEHMYRTTFSSALILAALSEVDTLNVQDIRRQLAAFLLTQKSEHWTFNYWTRKSKETKTLPYPDDLDDTFVALSALRLHQASLVDEAALAHIVKVLMAAEAEVGGPYRTWLVASPAAKEWRDVDMAVNANVAFFLSLVARPLPNLTKMLEDAIVRRRFSSAYYPSDYPLLYFIARGYKGSRSKELEEYILHLRKKGQWDTPLKTALATSSLLRLGHEDHEAAVDSLLKTQEEDGSWSADAFCLDPKRDGVVFYGGSPALTTAFVVETLVRYKTVRQDHTLTAKKHDDFLERRKESIISRLVLEYKQLDKDLQVAGLEMLKSIEGSKNGNEIILLPHAFYQSLNDPPPLASRVLDDLSRANIYGWTAYTIYDDFLDDEGDVRLLSVANVAMRRSTKAFHQALPDNAAFYGLAGKIFDTIDAANTWEVSHCRYLVREGSIHISKLPAYNNLNRLAERSLGHVLGPLGVLSAIGISVNSNESSCLLAAFRHYLIARQLNDDLHDWREDMQAGRMTYVLTVLLRYACILPGEYSLDELLPTLERYFWYRTLPYMCRRILYHVGTSRQNLAQVGVIRPENIISQLLDKIEVSVQETRTTTLGTRKFLQAYGDKTNPTDGVTGREIDKL